MQSGYDYREFAILYVDDEENSLKYFKRTFAKEFRIYTAANADAGFKLLEKHQDEIAVLMTDQRMPGEPGVRLLEKARQLRPRILRILVTAFSDIDAAIRAVNSGAIYKYITKPWETADLEVTLRRGIEFFIVERQRDELLKEKFSAMRDMVVRDRLISLGILAAGLNHHIRNSLVAVRTFLDLAPMKLEEENIDIQRLGNANFWKEFYAHVQGQVQRITEMLTDLGVASDLRGSCFQDKVEVADLVAKVVQNAGAQIADKGIVLENEIPRALPTLTVDLRKFQRLFELLLVDELVSLPAGSRIRLRGKVLSGARKSESQVQIELEDDGPGLSKQALRSVFDPFFLRSDTPKEFGINLMACYFLVYHHGGTLAVDSGEGYGTRFTLTFPIQPQARPIELEEKDFFSKVFLNEQLWEKFLAGA